MEEHLLETHCCFFPPLRMIYNVNSPLFQSFLAKSAPASCVPASSAADTCSHLAYRKLKVPEAGGKGPVVRKQQAPFVE
jgi:hypothetical protein